MTRWEFKCVFIWGGGKNASRIRNRYGREVWELVCASWLWHCLKRPLA